MSCEAMDSITELVDWFASPDGIYLRVFGFHKSSYMLLRYATNKLVMQKISYHVSIGLSTILQRKRKCPWPTFPLHVETCEIKNLKVAKAEGNELENFRFGIMEYHPYEPKRISKQDCSKIHFN